MRKEQIFMYNRNGRSILSREAIDNYQVPLTMINRRIIEEFLEENQDGYSMEELGFLESTALPKWRYVAEERIVHEEEIIYHSLFDIAEELLAIRDVLETDFQEYRKRKARETEKLKNSFRYGVMQLRIFGGSKSGMKVIGREEIAGIIIGEWLYYKYNHKPNGAINKHRIDSGKVFKVKEYHTYEGLTRIHPKYKDTEDIFEALIQQKVKRAS